jgi:hypothetical protein
MLRSWCFAVCSERREPTILTYAIASGLSESDQFVVFR